jgi:hypothetical protein
MSVLYRLSLLYFVSLIAFVQLTAQTGIPRTLNVQGVLTSSFGSTPLKGKQVFRVGIYESPLGGLPLHEQIDTVLVGETGLYQFSLGGMTGLPRTVKFDKPYFIDISVNGEKQNMRIPLQSAAYAFMAGAVENEAIGLEQLAPVIREKIFPEDKKGGEKALANYPNGFRAVIAGGDENRTSANYASILGGFTNTVSGAYGTVAGGQGNAVVGVWSFVGGGANNRAFGSYTTVAAGSNNVVSSSASFGTVGGGSGNQVGGVYATVSGGNSNTSSGISSVVGGGASNRTLQNFATVAGGSNNIASALGSTIAGGVNNSNSGQNGFIGGGTGNINSGTNAVVVGGMSNTATGLSSGITSGQSNTVTGSHSVVTGGMNNRITGFSSVIAGGTNNISSSNYSTISGGATNLNAADFGTVSGGGSNNVTSNGTYATIAGGQNNVNHGRFSGIGSGSTNNISQNSVRSYIASGDSNLITHTTASNNSNNSVIVGGGKNTISNSNYANIGSGLSNTVSTTSHYSSIGSGSQNIVTTGSDYSSIGGGLSSTITNSDYSSIGGGLSSTITNSNYASIAGGGSNTISSNSNYSTIGAGQSNSITSSVWSFIGSGNTNTIGIGSTASVIGGGEVNSITGNHSTVGGGRNNNISGSVQYSTIAGGRNNTVSADYATASGSSNTIGSGAHYGVAIGSSNQISAGVAATFGVAIGNSNRVTGSHGVAIGYNNTAAANAMAIGTSTTAINDEYSATYSAGFLFSSQGTNHGSHVADFVNTSSNGNGVRIKVNSCETDGPLVNTSNNFMTFVNKNNTVVGRIEGQTINELEDDPVYKEGLLRAILTVTSASVSVAGATGQLVVTSVDAATRSTCVFCPQLSVPGWKDVAIKSIDLASKSTTLASAIIALDGYKAARTNHMGVTYQSGNGDYAEYLPKLDKKEKFFAGQIVAIKGGFVTKNTDNATQLMVISKQPIVLGNAKPTHNLADFEKVAFLGQVPVTVLGEVKLGDYILPDGNNMGMGIAVSPENMNSDDYKRIVGVAWSASKTPVSEINVAVGLNGSAMSRELERQNTVNAKQEEQISMLKKIVCGMNTVISKLDPEYAHNIRKVLGTETETMLSEPVKKNVIEAKNKPLEHSFGGNNTIPGDMKLEARFLKESDIEYTLELARTKIKEIQGGSYSSSFFESYDSNPEFKKIFVENLKNSYNEDLYKQLEAMNAQAVSKQ